MTEVAFNGIGFRLNPLYSTEGEWIVLWVNGFHVSSCWSQNSIHFSESIENDKKRSCEYDSGRLCTTTCPSHKYVNANKVTYKMTIQFKLKRWLR